MSQTIMGGRWGRIKTQEGCDAVIVYCQTLSFISVSV